MGVVVVVAVVVSQLSPEMRCLKANERESVRGESGMDLLFALLGPLHLR